MLRLLIYFPGKNAEDDVRLSALNLKPSNKIMMMGTREENLVGLTCNTLFHALQTFFNTCMDISA